MFTNAEILNYINGIIDEFLKLDSAADTPDMRIRQLKILRDEVYGKMPVSGFARDARAVCDKEIFRLEESIRERYSRDRVTVTVEVNLDPVPGVFHTAESVANTIQDILTVNIGHYDPKVVLA